MPQPGPPLDALLNIQKLLVRIVDDAFDGFEAMHRFFIVRVLVVHLSLQLKILLLELKLLHHRVEHIDHQHIE